jgi:hypothetical protein
VSQDITGFDMFCGAGGRRGRCLELHAELVAMEREYGFTFQPGRSLAVFAPQAGGAGS